MLQPYQLIDQVLDECRPSLPRQRLFIFEARQITA